MFASLLLRALADLIFFRLFVFSFSSFLAASLISLRDFIFRISLAILSSVLPPFLGVVGSGNGGSGFSLLLLLPLLLVEGRPPVKKLMPESARLPLR